MVIATQLYIHYSAKSSIFIYLPFFQSISIYSYYAWHWLPHCRTLLWMLNALSFFSCMVPARTWFDWLLPSWAGVKRFVYISAADFGLVNYLLQGYYEGKVCLFFFLLLKRMQTSRILYHNMRVSVPFISWCAYWHALLSVGMAQKWHTIC